jgi:YD repeat-containing protein
VTQTGTQRYDAAGNLTFQSTGKYDSTYQYDAKDQLMLETRLAKGASGAGSQFRRVDYDILGRPETIFGENGVQTGIKYNEWSKSLTYQVTGLPWPVGGFIAYGWTGAIGSLRRTVGGKTYSYSASNPDSCGRAQTHQFGFGAMSVQLDYVFNSAGTRSSVELKWSDASSSHLLKRTFNYYPDWLLKTVVAPDGNYGFIYQINGALTAWTTPRGHMTTLAYDERGELAEMHALRSNGVDEFQSWTQTAVPSGAPGEGKEWTSAFTINLAKGETPDTGSAIYSSITTYGADGRPASVSRTRSGTALGGDVHSDLSFTYQSGQSSQITENHTFPSDPSKNYAVKRHVVDASNSLMMNSSLVMNPAAQKPEPPLETAANGGTTQIKDAWGRTVTVISRSFFSPDTIKQKLANVFASSWFSQQQWLQQTQTMTHDELGRLVYIRSTSDTLAASTGKSTVKNPGGFAENWLLHGLDNLVGARLDVVSTPIDTTTVTNPNSPPLIKTNYDMRLYVFDGNQLLAEFGATYSKAQSTYNQRLVRTYELGPGNSLRLAVNHHRDINGTWTQPPTFEHGVNSQRLSRGSHQYNLERLKRVKFAKTFQHIEHPFVFVRADDPNYLAILQERIPRPGTMSSA